MHIQLSHLHSSQQLDLAYPLTISEILSQFKIQEYKKVFLAKVEQSHSRRATSNHDELFDIYHNLTDPNHTDLTNIDPNDKNLNCLELDYVHLNYKVEQDCHIQLISTQSENALKLLRSSYAYLLSQAVHQLFPQGQAVQYQITDQGIYYDFANTPNFNAEHLCQIENQLSELVQQKAPLYSKMISRSQAIEIAIQQDNQFQQHWLQGLPSSTALFINQNHDFTDFFLSPLVPNSSFLEHFKITKVSGAYWQGDANQPMLQRIYLTCWADQKQLKVYLQQLEEAAKRDHRKLAQQLDLLHFDEKAPGAVFWHAKGWKLFQLLTDYLRQQQDDAGYIEVNTPDVMDRELWEISGHWQNYRQNMFSTQTEDGRIYALKPMSCPGAVCLYAHGLKSYRDLPLRMAEFGKVHRYEPSGSLHGLMRVRHFTQDDAHIFCTQAQLLSECKDTIALIYKIYQQFGFDEISIKVSTRPQHRIGSEETWDFLENTLIQALKQLSIDYELNEGEGAFYGPKLEFTLKDAIGREWQCGTIQVDLNLPERFDIHYIDEQNQKQRPVMLHRALFGSLERFIGILIEHYIGIFPFWLAPVQIVVLPISDAQHAYAEQLSKQLRQQKIRVSIDCSQEKLSYKIRSNTLQKIPYLIIVGDQEMQQSAVRLRAQDGKDLGTYPLSELSDFFAALQSNF